MNEIKFPPTLEMELNPIIQNRATFLAHTVCGLSVVLFQETSFQLVLILTLKSHCSRTGISKLQTAVFFTFLPIFESKVYGNTTMTILDMAAFVLYRQELSGCHRDCSGAQPKIFILWSFTEKKKKKSSLWRMTCP